MGEKRVIHQTASDEIYNDDWFLKDSVLHDTTKVQPSVIKEYVNQGMATATALANETTARANADIALGQRIDDEATARQQADTQLASGISKQMSNLADFYDTTTSYVVGDVVMQQSGDLLRCIAPTSGAFDITKWESVTVDELFDNLKLSDLGDDSTHRTVTDTEKSTWNAKQDALTFDDVPTDNSNNPVKSNGIYDAIASEASARSGADSTLQNNIDNLSNETIHIDSDGKFFVYVDEE